MILFSCAIPFFCCCFHSSIIPNIEIRPAVYHGVNVCAPFEWMRVSAQYSTPPDEICHLVRVCVHTIRRVQYVYANEFRSALKLKANKP